MKKYIALLVLATSLTGCALPFDRTYSLGYGKASFDMTLKGTPLPPPKPSKNIVPPMIPLGV